MSYPDYVGDRTYRRVLRALERHPGESYRDVAVRLQIAPSTVGLAVARGIEEGVLERSTCPACGSADRLQVVTPPEIEPEVQAELDRLAELFAGYQAVES